MREHTPSSRRTMMSGAHAIGRGAIEAGIDAATSYPGLQTGIMEYLSSKAAKHGFLARWSANERTALEIASGYSLCGLRSIVSMEHLGMNVASDTLIHVALVGTKGGMIVVSGEDIGGIGNATNEQDNRLYALLSHIPVLEPSGPNEAKRMVIEGFDLSEQFGTPILLRIATDVLFMTELVEIGNVYKVKRRAKFEKDLGRYFLLGDNIRTHHQRLHNNLLSIEKHGIQHKFDSVFNTQGENCIIASGSAFNQTMEGVRYFDEDKFSILKIGVPIPLSQESVLSFLQNRKKVVVFEETEPIIESKIYEISRKHELSIKIFGKLDNTVPEVGQLAPRIIIECLERIFNIDSSLEKSIGSVLQYSVPERRLSFCAGCPHRPAVFALKNVLKELFADKYLVVCDIGCNSLGAFPPFSVADTNINMGSSIGIACGIAKGDTEDFVVAQIGDSCLVHSAIPSLLEAVALNPNMLIYVNDNLSSGLTGGQHISCGAAEDEDSRKKLITGLIRACGVERIRVCDPYDIDETTTCLRDAIMENSLAVVVTQRKCAKLTRKELVQEGIKSKKFTVTEKCTVCGFCIEEFGCPALVQKENRIEICETDCIGCGVCTQVCPYGAIEEIG
jgi:indolepyruvate ferredoxin oxidoreductase alpha subunit